MVARFVNCYDAVVDVEAEVRQREKVGGAVDRLSIFLFLFSDEQMLDTRQTVIKNNQIPK